MSWLPYGVIKKMIGGGSYWAGQAVNVSGPPTFGHLIRPKKYKNNSFVFWRTNCSQMDELP